MNSSYSCIWVTLADMALLWWRRNSTFIFQSYSESVEQSSEYIVFDIYINTPRQTLLNSNQKHDIICGCFIEGTTPDHRGGLGIISFFDVAQGSFAKTFRHYRRTFGLEELMAPSKIPVGGFRPLLGLVISSAVLPQKLETNINESGTSAQSRRWRPPTVRHAELTTLGSSKSDS